LAVFLVVEAFAIFFAHALCAAAAAGDRAGRG
jgi:hypothetical protein